MRKTSCSITLALAGAMALFVAPVNATIISVSPTGGSTGTLVVNNSCPGGVDGPASLITGCLQNLNSNLVDFYSTTGEDLVFGNGGGQATVEPFDGATSNITIDPRNFLLGEIIVDIHKVSSGCVQFCDYAGCWDTLLALTGNGSNFFDITFDPASIFLSFNTYSDQSGTTSAALIEDTRQWRVTNVGFETSCTGNCGSANPVPEPGTLPLLGAGLLGIGAFGRRRKSKMGAKAKSA